MAIFTDSIAVWSFWPYCPELPRPFSPTVSLVVESASIWNMEYISCYVFEEKKGVGKQKKKKITTVSISSGSAEREHRGRAMSVLVKRGDRTSSMSSHQSDSWEELGRVLLSMKPLHWLRTKWLGVYRLIRPQH